MRPSRNNGPLDARRAKRAHRGASTRMLARSCRSAAPSVHVLLVATPRTFRESVAYFTRLLGLTSTAVASVATAVLVLNRIVVDMVVVDDALDVPTVLAAVQQPGRPAVLVIVITVAVTVPDLARWARIGVFACLPKPFDLRTYRQVVDRAVAVVRARAV